MLKRVVHLSVASLLCLPLVGCSGGDDENTSFSSFSTAGATFPTTAATAATTATMDEESSTDDSAGDGDGDPSTTDPSTTDPSTTDDTDDTDPSTTDDTSCPPGEFGCPCDNGSCVVGLECVNGECGFPQGDGDGDPPDPTTGGGNDPWDPNNCAPPSQLVSITDIEGSVCSAPCVSDIDCPAGPAGTNAACALILEGAVDPNQCALICDRLSDTCSPGSSCKEVPGQPGIGLCTYP